MQILVHAVHDGLMLAAVTFGGSLTDESPQMCAIVVVVGDGGGAAS